MPLLLSRRETTAVEVLDTGEGDPRKVRNTYRQFRRINKIGSRFGYVYRHWLRPHMYVAPSQTYTLLDIGFGGGDLTVALAQWALTDHFDMRVTGIDTSRSAVEFVSGLKAPPNVLFRHTTMETLLAEGAQYDFVVSNHVLHHLDDSALKTLLTVTCRLARRYVVMVDLRRSDFLFLLYTLLAPLALPNSYHYRDGRISIRRSRTLAELRQAVPDDWRITPLWPFRLALHRDPSMCSGHISNSEPLG